MLSERGEASGAAVARELHDSLGALGRRGPARLLPLPRRGLRPDAAKLRKAAEAWLAEPALEAAARLADAAEPPRQELLRRMNMAPGGTAALVAMREELLGRLRARARR